MDVFLVRLRIFETGSTRWLGGALAVAQAACVCALCAVAGLSAQEIHKPLDAVQGTLVQAEPGKVAVKAEGKEVAISPRSSYLLHTLEDKRLAGRVIRVEGVRKPDGSFEAWKFFTVRDGKLFRVRYYCDVCNIESLEPGRCVCCQRPTELQEIPADQSEP